MSDPRIESYEWAGGREAMLRFGPDHGPVVVLALPLFEEANRMRAFGVGMLRALAELGIGGILPELPGQGESEMATERTSLADLRAAFAAVPGSHAVAIRSGALLADTRPFWSLAPQDGPVLLRELARVRGGTLTGERVEVAGNVLGRVLLDDLRSSFFPGEGRGPVAPVKGAHPALADVSRLGTDLRRGGARVVRLASDSQPADRHIGAPPLWRRAEPDNDSAFAQILAIDIADWIATCAV